MEPVAYDVHAELDDKDDKDNEDDKDDKDEKMTKIQVKMKKWRS